MQTTQDLDDDDDDDDDDDVIISIIILSLYFVAQTHLNLCGDFNPLSAIFLKMGSNLPPKNVSRRVSKTGGFYHEPKLPIGEMLTLGGVTRLTTGSFAPL